MDTIAFTAIVASAGAAIFAALTSLVAVRRNQVMGRQVAVERQRRLREELKNVVDAALTIDRAAEQARWHDADADQIGRQLRDAMVRFDDMRAALLLEAGGKQIAEAFDALVRQFMVYMVELQNRDQLLAIHDPRVEEHTRHVEQERASVRGQVDEVVRRSQSAL